MLKLFFVSQTKMVKKWWGKTTFLNLIAGFFAVIIGIVGFFIYLCADGKTVKKDAKINPRYEMLDNGNLANYD
jgi:ABC-type thiamine transport system ATPase subunit